jgi:hypothetical protein
MIQCILPQIFFHEKISKIIFHLSRTPSSLSKTFTGHKHRGSWEGVEVAPVLPVAGQIFARYLEDYLELFPLF